MPYYVHTVDNLPLWREGLTWRIIRTCERDGHAPFARPSVCLEFPDAKTANARRQALGKAAKTDGSGVDWAPVVFMPTYQEAEDWRERESGRLAGELPPEYDKDGKVIHYAPVPWRRDYWYCSENRDSDENSLTWAGTHYAHMSRVMPGQVAFTPTEEYGVTNRKIRMTVARYLDKFARDHSGHPVLTKTDIARYVAIVKAHADQSLKIARAGAEIVKVYLTGPPSCMSHPVDDYDNTNGIHPVFAYGESDLGVAYLGDPNSGVSARSVVWPNKKIYVRIYGDDTLKLILEDQGYKNGSLTGATFPAIRLTGGRYLCPYVDSPRRDDSVTADLITKANGDCYFKLRGVGGEYDVKVTEGVATVAEDLYTCSNCGEEISARESDDQNGLCQGCYHDQWTCARCGDASFDIDDAYSSDDGDSYCESCWNALFARCTKCNDAYEKSEDRISKRDRGMSDYCADCSADRMICDACGEIVDDDPVETTCADCRQETEDETAETDKETETV
jgi:hypothetical protein